MCIVSQRVNAKYSVIWTEQNRVYLQDNYFTRKTSKLPDKKSYKKIKLWKIDTSFGVKAWINLISLLCNGSEIIIQYFNPEEFEQMFELRVRDFKACLPQQAEQTQEQALFSSRFTGEYSPNLLVSNTCSTSNSTLDFGLILQPWHSNVSW